MDNTCGLYRCNKCNKEYSSYKSLWNHNKKFHLVQKQLYNENITKNITNINENITKNIIKKFNCKYCNKQFNYYQNNWDHEKNYCKKKDILELNNKLIDTQIINNQINTINNNNQKQIIINQIGKESINCLPIKDILKIIGDGYNMPISCIKKINFNKNLPENHSFCTTKLEGKHFTRINHKTQKPEKINKIDFINEVLESSLKFINSIHTLIEFDDEYRNNIPIEYQSKIKDIIDNQHKFNEVKNKKAFFNCINDLSYNFKDIIFETWKLIQPTNYIEDSDEPPLIDENFNYISSDEEV